MSKNDSRWHDPTFLGWCCFGLFVLIYGVIWHGFVYDAIWSEYAVWGVYEDCPAGRYGDCYDEEGLVFDNHWIARLAFFTDAIVCIGSGWGCYKLRKYLSTRNG